MVVAIAGAHGKIGMRLTRLLAADGDRVIGVIRNPNQADDVREAGGDPVVCDLEHARPEQVASAIEGADAAVFAAGAGAGSGAERKLTMDRDGAIKFLQAAVAVGAPRYVIVSAVGAEAPPDSDDVFSVYLRAKAEADQAAQSSDRDWTVVRPGRLTDDPATGHVRIDTAPFRGSVSRDDVAAILVRLLRDPRASRKVLYVNGGDEELDQALAQVLGAR